jgi:hypothetical protein
LAVLARKSEVLEKEMKAWIMRNKNMVSRKATKRPIKKLSREDAKTPRSGFQNAK